MATYYYGYRFLWEWNYDKALTRAMELWLQLAMSRELCLGFVMGMELRL